jgi:hypothetical protein
MFEYCMKNKSIHRIIRLSILMGNKASKISRQFLLSEEKSRTHLG